MLKYTISLSNTGNIAANDVRIKDTIPNGSNFVNNSVVVNNVYQPNALPQSTTGILVGKIEPGSSATTTFNVQVITVPSSNKIENSANITFNYVVNPSIPSPIVDSSNSNIITTNVSYVKLNSVMSSDKVGASIGDIITYNIFITNTGNADANAIIIRDTIPNGLAFIQDSVIINNDNKFGTDISSVNGIQVDNLSSQGLLTISFKVSVTTIPVQNPIQNSAVIEYLYTSNPNVPNGVKDGLITNIVKVRIGEATLKLYKFVDKKVAKLNDNLIYSLVIRNTGNITASNIAVIDTIPEGTSFADNSFKVGNSIKLNQNPQPPNGILIGSLGVGEAATISFKVIVITIPATNKINNSATVNFEFFPDPSIPNGTKGSAASDTVSTEVRQAELSIRKIADVKNAKLGQEINYIVEIKNVGNIVAENAFLIDTIPIGTSLVANSVKINDAIRLVSIMDSKTPLALGSVDINSLLTVTFKLKIEAIPTSNKIINNANVKYSYTLEPSKISGESGVASSNEVITSIKQAIIDYNFDKGLVKSTNKPYVKLKDEITYSIVLKNTGNADAYSVFLIDTIPNGLSFIPNSVIKNGQNLPGESPEPPNGINIGEVKVGGSVNISFKAVVENIPYVNPIVNSSYVKFIYFPDPLYAEVYSGGNSNSVTNKVSFASISKDDGGFKLQVDKINVGIGDVLTYTATLTNTGNVSADKVIFIDTIPNSIQFVTNSVKVSGVKIQGANPATGILIGNIPPGDTRIVVFETKVRNAVRFEEIINIARVKYSFTVDNNNINDQTVLNSSNEVKSSVKGAIISKDSGGIKIDVDKLYATLNSIVTYTLVLINKGNIVANNVIVKKLLPNYVELVSGSITVDGVSTLEGIDSNSVRVGDVQPLIPVKIIYQGKITSVWNSSLGRIISNVDVNYEYSVE